MLARHMLFMVYLSSVWHNMVFTEMTKCRLESLANKPQDSPQMLVFCC